MLSPRIIVNLYQPVARPIGVDGEKNLSSCRDRGSTQDAGLRLIKTCDVCVCVSVKSVGNRRFP